MKIANVYYYKEFSFGSCPIVVELEGLINEFWLSANDMRIREAGNTVDKT